MLKKEEITSMEDVRGLPREAQIKYEIAEEIGVLDKVFQNGWKTLSAKESGKIGGILASRKKQNANSPKATQESPQGPTP